MVFTEPELGCAAPVSEGEEEAVGWEHVHLLRLDARPRLSAAVAGAGKYRQENAPVGGELVKGVRARNLHNFLNTEPFLTIFAAFESGR